VLGDADMHGALFPVEEGPGLQDPQSILHGLRARWLAVLLVEAAQQPEPQALDPDGVGLAMRLDRNRGVGLAVGGVEEAGPLSVAEPDCALGVGLVEVVFALGRLTA
jgi:hypothetical protein